MLSSSMMVKVYLFFKTVSGFYVEVDQSTFPAARLAIRLLRGSVINLYFERYEKNEELNFQMVALQMQDGNAF